MHAENYDDKVEEGDDVCTKNFLKQGRGHSYCFVIFCTLHGHCYGFNVIKGGEGRKDPFHAMAKYMTKAPEVIFYDFACQLNEYCQNREPAFFSNTKFYHDVFHSVNHNCPFVFHSRDQEEERCYNTSCCEQFNRFIKLIQRTGQSLQLSRFMIYSQYHMYHYNQGRTEHWETKMCGKEERCKPDNVPN